jgi:hypothetical protein
VTAGPVVVAGLGPRCEPPQLAKADARVSCSQGGEIPGRCIVARNIARLNIEHFRRLLAAETDPAKRTMILQPLAEEEAKLAGLDNTPKKLES